MQPVFDGPVLSDEPQECFRVGLQAGQTGDRELDLNARRTHDRALARDAANLLGAGPIQPRRNLGQGFDGSRFEAAMAFVMRRGGLQVCLARYRLLRGKQGPRRRRGWLVLGRAGCL